MALNFAFVPLVYYCYPETKNLTLEEIDDLFITSEEGAVKLSVQVANHGWPDRILESRAKVHREEKKPGAAVEEERVENVETGPAGV